MKIAAAYGTLMAVALGLSLTALPAVPAAHASPARTLASDRQPGLGRGSMHLIGGVVQLANGRPDSGVCVTAAGPMGAAFARTAADGRYQLAVQRPGRYVLAYRDCRAVANGRAGRVIVAPTAARQVQAAGAATVVPLVTLRKPTSHSILQAALAVAGVTVPRTSRHATARAGAAAPGTPPLNGIAGKVISPSGRPLGGICVWVIGKGFAEGRATNRNGTYSLKSEFQPGWYPVEFESNCNAFPFPAGPWAPEWYRHVFSQAAATKVHIRAGQITRHISAVMERDGEITGTVTGAHGRKLKGVCVVLVNRSNVEVNQATTSMKGTYRLGGLDPGRYRELFVPGCGGAYDYGPTWWPHAATFAKAHPISVRLRHVTKGIDARLQELGTITGQVRLRNKSGRPLGGMCVNANLANDPFSAGGFASTKPNGTYVMPGLPAGKYQVSVFPGCNNNGNYLSANYPRLVNVTDGLTISGIDVYLQLGGIVSGTVRSAATGKPISGICVFDNAGAGGVTKTDGTYRFDQIPPGLDSVEFYGGCGNSGSYAPQWYPGQDNSASAANIRIRAGHDTAGINAAMLAGATIAGRTTGPSGKARGGVCVSVVDRYYFGNVLGDLGAQVITRGGRYSLTNLAPDDYAIAFSGDCGLGTTGSQQQWYRDQPTYVTAGLVNARAGAPVTGVDAIVSPGGSISGDVLKGAGQHVPFGCVVAINTRTGIAGGNDAIDFGSGYLIGGLAPGRYAVWAYDCGGRSLATARYRTLVTVRAKHDTGHVNIVLPKGGVITGRVTIRGSGKPAAGVCVLAGTGITGSGAVTGADGRYRVTNLNTGSYRVRVETAFGCERAGEDLAPANLPGLVHVTAGRITSGVNGSVGQGGAISGHVAGPGGHREPGTCVEAFALTGGQSDQVATGPAGRYELSGLAAGRYKVLFGDPSCSFGPIGLAQQWYNGALGRTSASTVVVTAGQVRAEVNATLGTDGTVTGSVTGSAKARLSGICVTAVPVSRYLPPVYTTSSGGSYTLSELLPGRYRIEFQPGCGATGWAAQWWKDASSSRKATVLTVVPGSVTTGISAAMTAGG